MMLVCKEWKIHPHIKGLSERSGPVSHTGPDARPYEAVDAVETPLLNAVGTVKIQRFCTMK